MTTSIFGSIAGEGRGFMGGSSFICSSDGIDGLFQATVITVFIKKY
jgi:hypothetical protein